MESQIRKMKAKAYSVMLLFACLPISAMASGSSGASAGLGKLIGNITDIFQDLESLIIGVCYVAGVGFAAAGIMKFKQYKDNPSQVTLGAPITMIFIAAALLWLPGIISSTGETIFGTDYKNEAGKVQGGTIFGNSGK